MAYSYIIWFFDVISDSFTLPKSSKYINTKFNQQNEKILNDDLFKSDFNIKSRIEKYKMKLSLNNMFLFRNSQNSPKININIFDTYMHLNSAFVKRSAKKKMTVLVGPQLTHLKKLKKDKNTQAKKIISNPNIIINLKNFDRTFSSNESTQTTSKKSSNNKDNISNSKFELYDSDKKYLEDIKYINNRLVINKYRTKVL